MAAVGVSVALAVLAPLLWLSMAYPLEDGMVVIDRSAALLLHHGLPYLAADQVTGWLSYNPYLPVMTLFGLPSAAGLGGLAGGQVRGDREERAHVCVQPVGAFQVVGGYLHRGQLFAVDRGGQLGNGEVMNIGHDFAP